MENDLAKINIWNGLKKRLPYLDKKQLPPREVLIRATKKANKFTPPRRTKDYSFLIQRYTACR